MGPRLRHGVPRLAQCRRERLYLFSQKGTALVVEAARSSRKCSAPKWLMAFTPARPLPPTEFLRGVTNVWCLGPAAPKDPPAGKP